LACTRTGNNRLKEPSRFYMVIPPQDPSLSIIFNVSAA
jgi:hypothetical protein